MPDVFKLKWDEAGKRIFELGCDRGVVYPVNSDGTYTNGEAWNGLSGIDESPGGADSKKIYANNGVYANLRGEETYSGSIKAYMAPDIWNECDGHPEVVAGITVGQQNRRGFGLSYRTGIGNDTEGLDHGYEIHMVWGASVSPTSQSHVTMTDSPDPEELSWSFDTVPTAVEFPGFRLKKTATLVINSTKVNADALAEFEKIIYGYGEEEARLPLPTEVLEFFENYT